MGPGDPAWLSLTLVAAVLVATVLAGTVWNSATREQAVLERRFGLLDIDGNGVWQRDDYQQLTASVRRLRPRRRFGDGAGGDHGAACLFDMLLTHMDANGDQEISKDEFMAAWAGPSRTVLVSTPRRGPPRAAWSDS